MQVVIGLVVAVVGFLFVRGLASAPGAAPVGGGATRTRVLVPAPSVPPLPLPVTMPPGSVGHGWTGDQARAVAISMKNAGRTPAEVIEFLDMVPPPPPVGTVDTRVFADTCNGRPDCGASRF